MIEFFDEVETTLNHLVASNFSPTNKSQTLLMIESCEDDDYLLTIILDKIENIVKNSLESNPADIYRKFIQTCFEATNLNIIHRSAKYLSNKRDPEQLLILIEEMRLHYVDTTAAENLFLYLCNTSNYSLYIIDQFLSITKGSYPELAASFLRQGWHFYLNRIIKLMSSDDYREQLSGIINVLINHDFGDRPNPNYYIDSVFAVLNNTSEYTSILLEKGPLDLATILDKLFLLVNSANVTMKIVSNIYSYLQELDPEQLDAFELRFISEADPTRLVEYAEQIQTSNKRRILKKLILARDEYPTSEIKNLIKFTQLFPEYKHLLPML